jgi:flagella basal body P-ring formation protein FlgA
LIDMMVTAAFRIMAIASLVGACAPAWADSSLLPVPSITIYPGDIIRDGAIMDRDFGQNYQPSRYGVVVDRAAVVGKIARRTLLPGAPIPINATMEPKVVSAGAKVRIVFQESGMTISTFASALQQGAVGDVVSVRNIESGLTVSGIVQADGTVRVNGG